MGGGWVGGSAGFMVKDHTFPDFFPAPFPKINCLGGKKFGLGVKTLIGGSIKWSYPGTPSTASLQVNFLFVPHYIFELIHQFDSYNLFYSTQLVELSDLSLFEIDIFQYKSRDIHNFPSLKLMYFYKSDIFF